ncbi:MAG: pilus assembly PilX N-terminal domain-containing protein [Desulfamplus sp.]|nr:pilus assembly PilX N-terminal domain-containing protein [Desulfamplus sp.]
MKRFISNLNTVFRPVHNENGSAILISMIVLVLLTLIGISATNTSQIELQIAGNEKIYRQNFNLAEAGTTEAVQILKSTPPEALKDDNKFTYGNPAYLSWLKPDGTNMKDTSNAANWNTNSALNNNVKYAAVEHGLAGGASIDLTASSQLYEYSIFGLSENNNGQSLIQIGYRRRF